MAELFRSRAPVVPSNIRANFRGKAWHEAVAWTVTDQLNSPADFYFGVEVAAGLHLLLGFKSSATEVCPKYFVTFVAT